MAKRTKTPARAVAPAAAPDAAVPTEDVTRVPADELLEQAADGRKWREIAPYQLENRAVIHWIMYHSRQVSVDGFRWVQDCSEFEAICKRLDRVLEGFDTDDAQGAMFAQMWMLNVLYKWGMSKAMLAAMIHVYYLDKAERRARV